MYTPSFMPKSVYTHDSIQKLCVLCKSNHSSRIQSRPSSLNDAGSFLLLRLFSLSSFSSFLISLCSCLLAASRLAGLGDGARAGEALLEELCTIAEKDTANKRTEKECKQH